MRRDEVVRKSRVAADRIITFIDQLVDALASPEPDKPQNDEARSGTPDELVTALTRIAKARGVSPLELYIGITDEIFCIVPDGAGAAIYCEPCAQRAGVDLSRGDVVVFEVGEAGFTKPCVCSRCYLSIPVIVDAVGHDG